MGPTMVSIHVRIASASAVRPSIVSVVGLLITCIGVQQVLTFTRYGPCEPAAAAAGDDAAENVTFVIPLFVIPSDNLLTPPGRIHETK